MGPDAPGPFDRLRAGTGHGRGKRRPFDYAQGRPYGRMVGRAGERWKGEVARERQTGGRFTAVAVVRRER